MVVHIDKRIMFKSKNKSKSKSKSSSVSVSATEPELDGTVDNAIFLATNKLSNLSPPYHAAGGILKKLFFDVLEICRDRWTSLAADDDASFYKNMEIQIGISKCRDMIIRLYENKNKNKNVKWFKKYIKSNLTQQVFEDTVINEGHKYLCNILFFNIFSDEILDEILYYPNRFKLSRLDMFRNLIKRKFDNNYSYT